MKNFHSNGDFIEFTAGADITSGMIVKVGSLFGVAVTSVANGGKGVLALKGVFTLPKTTGTGTAIAVGGAAYFDTSAAATGAVSGDAETAANPLCGYAIEAAADGASTAKVRLLG
jgi:predicted RecA/RadA family phage recombinase